VTDCDSFFDDGVASAAAADRGDAALGKLDDDRTMVLLKT
jgi:hypothetical protein